MKFTLTIDCGNVAFVNECGGDLFDETSNILFRLGSKIKEERIMFSYVYDSNGNKVGQAQFIEDSENS